MKKETLKWLVATVLLVVAISQSCVEGAPQVPCFFIFGDSLVDNGNNNLLPTLAKVNYSPYGIDYPGEEPTGRFTNGKTTVDILAELLGLDPIPPFSTTSTRSPKIKFGLNYGSGGAGIRGETGLLLGKVISLDEQLLRHQITVGSIGSLLRKNTSQTLKYMNKCLYSVGMDSNDYINNYYSNTTTCAYYNTPEKYAQALIDQYKCQMLDLYKHGARKVALVGLGPIGCTPNAISKSNGTACVAHMNSAAQLFNKKLVCLVGKFNTNLTDAKFIHVDSMGIAESTFVDFKVSNVGCCPVDYISGLCVPSPLGTPCQNRNEYVFWNAYHPTEAFNKIAASRIYRSFESTDNYPMDVNRLVQLDLK